MDPLRPQRPVRPRQEDPRLHSRGTGPLPLFAPDPPQEPSVELAQDGQIRGAGTPHVPQHHQLRGRPAAPQGPGPHAPHRYLPRLRRHPAQSQGAHLPHRREEHRGGDGHVCVGTASVAGRASAGRNARKSAGPGHKAGCAPPARSPGGDRLRIPEPGPFGGYALRRRGPEMQDSQVHQLVPLRPALYPRRAQRRPAQPRHRPAQELGPQAP